MTDLKATINKKPIILNSTDDAMSIIYSGNEYWIFLLSDLRPDFFDLKNGFAGEVFQKFINYRFHVAFIIPPDHNLGERINELIKDHYQHPFIRFFQNKEKAEAWLKTI